MGGGMGGWLGQGRGRIMGGEGGLPAAPPARPHHFPAPEQSCSVLPLLPTHAVQTWTHRWSAAWSVWGARSGRWCVAFLSGGPAATHAGAVGSST